MKNEEQPWWSLSLYLLLSFSHSLSTSLYSLPHTHIIQVIQLICHHVVHISVSVISIHAQHWCFCPELCKHATFYQSFDSCCRLVLPCLSCVKQIVHVAKGSSHVFRIKASHRTFWWPSGKWIPQFKPECETCGTQLTRAIKPAAMIFLSVLELRHKVRFVSSSWSSIYTQILDVTGNQTLWLASPDRRPILDSPAAVATHPHTSNQGTGLE